MTQAKAVPERSTIAPQYLWNAESLFETREAWKAEYERLMNEVDTLTRFQGRLGGGPDTLVDWLRTSADMAGRVGKVFVYGIMSQQVNTSDPDAVAMGGQATTLNGRMQAAISFAEPELIAIGREQLEAWIQQDERLAVYAQYVDNLFRRAKHVRSAEVEEVIGLAADPFATADNTAELLANADLQFKNAVAADGTAHPVTQGTLGGLLNNADREVRRTAYESYSEGYLTFKNTFANNLIAAFKKDVFMARVRRYPSTLEASLHENNIPVAVYRNLIDTYKKNLPTWHRYWAVRRKALGVEELRPYDIWAPLTSAEQHVTYEDAVEWVCQGMQPLGDEYVNVVWQGCLQDRWVDVYPTKGKRQGAFSFGVQGTHPFIMHNFNENIYGMSTLAHELGHSMHSYLAWKTQPYVYSDYSLFVAEVASNFNQAMVRDYLLKQNDDPQFQIAVIEEAMNNFHRYFFIMPTLARFELEIHERVERGEGVTADDMNALMADLFAEGYGDEMAYDRAQVGITWAQFGHLYSAYYVYQYATGISAAHALARRVLEGGDAARDNYLKFLSAGSSLYPIDALKLAGVDMASPEAVEQTFATLAGYVDRLATLTGQ